MHTWCASGVLHLRAPAAIAVQDVLHVEQLLQVALVRIRPNDDGVWVELAHDAPEAKLRLLVAVGTWHRATAAATGHLRCGAHGKWCDQRREAQIRNESRRCTCNEMS
jgi:hypothetical protein